MSSTTQKYVYIRTFGCQMNEHDTQKIYGLLAQLNYSKTDDPNLADLVLFNTCTIREKAHHKAMSEIGRSRFYKKRVPKQIVGVCGCVAQEVRESIFTRYPHVDILFGPDEIHKLPQLLKEAKENGRATDLDLIDDSDKYVFLDGVPQDGVVSPSAFVSIMKGCNCACSYCIVPSVRGREVCRPSEDIIREVQKLAELGTKECVLLGQNVNAYSHDISFAKLIHKISHETDIARIRFTSPHPKDVGDDLIKEYSTTKKLMPHIHLPVQAGGNETLKKMRRGYTKEHYLALAKALRNSREYFSITTDIIVGFCGETENEFEDTIDLMTQIEFDSCFAFKYSPRPGTEAFLKFKDDVPEEEKTRRLNKVFALQNENSLKRGKQLIGKDFKVLVVSADKMNKGLLTGRLPDNRLIHFSGLLDEIGNILNVKITEAHLNSLTGEMIDA